jgi:hypothetical protein
MNDYKELATVCTQPELDAIARIEALEVLLKEEGYDQFYIDAFVKTWKGRTK